MYTSWNPDNVEWVGPGLVPTLCIGCPSNTSFTYIEAIHELLRYVNFFIYSDGQGCLPQFSSALVFGIFCISNLGTCPTFVGEIRKWRFVCIALSGAFCWTHGGIVLKKCAELLNDVQLLGTLRKSGEQWPLKLSRCFRISQLLAWDLPIQAFRGVEDPCPVVHRPSLPCLMPHNQSLENNKNTLNWTRVCLVFEDLPLEFMERCDRSLSKSDMICSAGPIQLRPVWVYFHPLAPDSVIYRCTSSLFFSRCTATYLSGVPLVRCNAPIFVTRMESLWKVRSYSDLCSAYFLFSWRHFARQLFRGCLVTLPPNTDFRIKGGE